MRYASRIDILSRMIDLRRLIGLPEGADPEPYKRAWKEAQGAESDMLEIAELAYVLQADGFPVPEVFKRIGEVLDPPSSDLAEMHKRLGHWSDPLRHYLTAYLKRHNPAYLALGANLFGSALTIARMWGEIYAGRLTASNWPPPDMLDAKAARLETIDILLDGGCAMDARRVKARAVPGDEIHNYSTGTLSWAAMMGSAGLALVRNGRSIDHIETMIN